jgi:hypothetical protein
MWCPEFTNHKGHEVKELVVVPLGFRDILADKKAGFPFDFLAVLGRSGQALTGALRRSE